MYHEDVKVKNGETVSGIGADFGYRITEWHKIWDDPKNAPLVKKRGKPEHLQIDDVVWVKIPWHTVTRRLTADANGASFLVQRNDQVASHRLHCGRERKTCHRIRFLGLGLRPHTRRSGHQSRPPLSHPARAPRPSAILEGWIGNDVDFRSGDQIRI